MAENLAGDGLTFKRADGVNNAASVGKRMRMRGGAIVRGELVRIDFTSSDALINTNFTDIDFGSETVASSIFASVIKVSAITAHDIVGVALESAAQNAMVRVEFAEGGVPTIVYALSGAITTIGLPLTAAADGRLDPTTTTAKGKVLARALNPTTTADGDLIRVLFYGSSGVGFQESA